MGNLSRLRRSIFLFLCLFYVASAAQVVEGVPASHEDTPLTASISYAQPGSSTTLFDRVGRFISSIFPNEDSNVEGDGGFFGGDGTTIAWGGSTLEVVKTQATYLTRAAAFGPRITSDEGLKGHMLPISDFYHPINKSAAFDSNIGKNYGCPFKGGPGWNDEDFDDDNNGIDRVSPSDLIYTDSKAKPGNDWIALVERGGQCSFVSKVRVAQALGAKAVVVGDAPNPDYEDGEHTPGEESDPGLSGRLVTMYAPGVSSDIKIPSTFITRPSYVDLIRLIDETEKERQEHCVLQKKEGKDCNARENGLEVILGRDDIMWEWPLIDLAFILLLLPSFMTLTTIIVHRIRLTRQRRRERAPELVVLGLPCLIWRPDGQPWEKIEGSEDGITTSSEQQATSKGASSNILINTDDMELGTTQVEEEVALVPRLSEGADQAGPSSLPLKTVPVLPPAPIRSHSQLPPGRTYYSCDECAICLSEFVDGDQVRVLPCGHVFHLLEIDSWLLRIKKLCPICKRDITVPIPPTPPAPSLHSPASIQDVAAEDLLNDGDAEATPLLAHS
ncbi:hypothetical protein CBS101457_002445 [Exobasidium rhododendri]|nr:hypothetical protein CBS101457_002445 [Exobasidium rhododendri]